MMGNSTFADFIQRCSLSSLRRETASAGLAFHRLISFVIHDGESAIRAYGVQLLGNQYVQIFVVALERSETIGIPADVVAGAQRIVTRGNFAEIRDPAASSLAAGNDFRGNLEFQRADKSAGCPAANPLGADTLAAMLTKKYASSRVSTAPEISMTRRVRRQRTRSAS